ncbi:S-layer homology domain-containing protein [Bacillus sp. 1P06AnD]|uniref:S-layer homology domain-containing protein n=1 Tax=Bacillus sp. 1P06AnD TaxID=3132208 RepID=UPI0039A1FA6D
MKKIISFIASIVLIASILPITYASAKENIGNEMQAMIKEGIITGYGDGTYKPNGTVTRGEFATFLKRALDLPDGPHVFKDVSKTSSLAAGINAAAKAKIVRGISSETFAPNQLITREQMAIMINNALTYKNIKTKTTSVTVADMNRVGAEETKLAIKNMIGQGIIKGYTVSGGMMFKPKDHATRQQGAAFIYRLLNVIGKTSGNTNTPETPAAYEPSAFEKKVVELTNAERAKQGLKPLILDTEASRVAHAKAEDMKVNNYFSHTSPTYGGLKELLQKFGIKNWHAAGENIAKGQPTPESVVSAWMNSAGHRANILNPNFTHMGAGYVSSPNVWVQEFLGK